jgi:hypothetical protein
MCFDPASLHGIDETQVLKTCLRIDESSVPFQLEHKVSNLRTHHQLHISLQKKLIVVHVMPN